MSEFKELIKRFDKVRAYVRDFYIYGFKSRDDYQEKSLRTYDNERRRLENWFSDYIRTDQKGHKKSVFLTLDSSRIAVNPLYQTWKSKTFTDRDIALHFFLLDLLCDGRFHSVEELADEIQTCYGYLADTQTIRRKLLEYEREGILLRKKEGKQYLFALDSDLKTSHPKLFPALSDAICFFQGAAPFGFVGNTIMDFWKLKNPYFRFRSDYLVHTLEDEILLPLLQAIEEHRAIELTIKSTKSGRTRQFSAVPLKILVSTQTGRRYACVHQKSSRRLAAYRLDSIRNVILLEPDSDFQAYEDALAAHLPHVWGVSFGSKRKPEQVCLRIRLNEADEPHIINRLEREGRHGTLKRLEPGLYEYTNTCWDAAELLPWIKSFTGRIVSFTCSNPGVEKRLWDDIRLMGQLYENQPGPQSPGKNPAEHGNKEGENILK